MSKCIHNARCRDTEGFYCEDCETYFAKDSPTYRSGELLSTLWMVLNNINVDVYANTGKYDPVIAALKEEIGIGEQHDNYEDIITRVEIAIHKYSKDANSANVEI